jgi:hypothetical protein
MPAASGPSTTGIERFLVVALGRGCRAGARGAGTGSRKTWHGSSLSVSTPEGSRTTADGIDGALAIGTVASSIGGVDVWTEPGSP